MADENDDGPFIQFCDELDELIVRWRNKPLDDCLTAAEYIGALETVKHKIIAETLEDFK